MGASTFIFIGTVVAAVAAVLLGMKEESPVSDGIVMGSGEMFDKVAPQYDLVNTVLTMRMDEDWRRQMIDSLNLKPGRNVDSEAQAKLECFCTCCSSPRWRCKIQWLHSTTLWRLCIYEPDG